MLKNKRILRSTAILLLICFSISSCKLPFYYKVKSPNSKKETPSQTLTSENIRSEYEAARPVYFVHVGDKYWELKEYKVIDQKVTGVLAEVDDKYRFYYEKALYDRKFKVSKSDLKYINQVHIFTNEIATGDDGLISFGTSEISKVDLMKENKEKRALVVTTVSTGIAVAGIATIGTVFLLIACGCPHNYIYDGEKYHFTNTLFTGATSEKLERNDYKPLPDFFPGSSTYHMLIRNEENEIHQTNVLELMVVDHDKNVSVYTDQKGSVYSVSNAQKALAVSGDNKEDLTHILAYEDDLGHAFDNQSAGDYANVYASFKAPEDKKNTKLILKAKNSNWAGFVYEEFSKLFGNKYDDWNKKANERSAEEVNAYRKQAGVHLLVSVKKGNEWIDLETIDLIGEANYNSLIVNIPEELIGQSDLEVRLRSGFMLWDVDYIGLDDSAPVDLQVQYLKPAKVVSNSVQDVTAALSADDEKYMEHVSGDSALVNFEGLNISTKGNRSIFLRSKGYYLIQDEYSGKPDRKELAKYKDAVELSRLSRKLYDQYKDQISLTIH